MPSPRSEFVAGVKAELPILLGVIPFGLIYGVLASGAGLPASLAQAMSSIVFAGSAQFIAAQLIGTGAPALVLILTTLVVNLRHMLYSASVAPYVKHLRPQWKWLLAYLLTDEAYAVTILHYQDQEADDAPPVHKHWFFLGAGLALWSTWQASTGVGIFVGAQVPASWSLDFTLALTFIALVVPALKDRAGWVAALVGGTVAVLAAGLPFKLGLILAALIGILAGLGVERYAASQPSPASLASPDRRGVP
jgi:4-azaleucine resistance transporter AzlC